jgi:hypothetical protein
MFEYWSWKERGLVIGLAVLAAVFAYVAFSTSASLESQMEKLRVENSELRAQLALLRDENAALSRRLELGGLSASWDQQGGLCVLRLRVPSDPGWWEFIRRGNRTGAGGYFALVLLVDDNGLVAVPGALRFYNATAEVWFACSGGKAVGVYASLFEYGRNSFHMFIPYDYEKGFLIDRFPCRGFCGEPVPLARPIVPKYVDVLLFFYPPGVNGLDYILYEHGYAVRLNVTAAR